MSVYFVEHRQAKRIKIGVAASPTKRMSSLRTGNPDLRMLGWIPGDRTTEQKMHELFRAYWLIGEWYRDCKGIRKAIAGFGLEGRERGAVLMRITGRPRTVRHIPRFKQCPCVECRRKRVPR